MFGALRLATYAAAPASTGITIGRSRVRSTTADIARPASSALRYRRLRSRCMPARLNRNRVNTLDPSAGAWAVFSPPDFYVSPYVFPTGDRGVALRGLHSVAGPFSGEYSVACFDRVSDARELLSTVVAARALVSATRARTRSDWTAGTVTLSAAATSR